MRPDPSPAVSRREFVASAVAIGGASALSACLEREIDDPDARSDGTAESQGDGTADPQGDGTGQTPDAPDPGEANFPQGPDDPDELPERQHAWNDYIPTDPTGDTRLPEQQLLLFFEYAGSVPPTDDEREAVEGVLRSVERAYARGVAANRGDTFMQGLLFLVGYTPTYFDRFDASLPADLDLQRPGAVMDRLDEDGTPVDADVVVLLNADQGSIPLAVEQALNGELDRINGVDVEGAFHDVFEQVERRSAVVGRGNPHDELDHDAIEEHAPLSMGFKSGFDDSNPAEDRVTWSDGPFAGGTTLHVSRLGIDLDEWYDLADDRQVKQMFTTDHTREDVGPTGERLGADSGVRPHSAEDLEEKAAEHGCLGHSAKTARARDDQFQPVILRRSEGNTTDPDHDAGMNFTSLQSGIEDFVRTRQAMNDPGGDVDPSESGIVDFLTTESRNTFLVPPRSLRALPSPRPDA